MDAANSPITIQEIAMLGITAMFFHKLALTAYLVTFTAQLNTRVLALAYAIAFQLVSALNKMRQHVLQPVKQGQNVCGIPMLGRCNSACFHQSVRPHSPAVQMETALMDRENARNCHKVKLLLISIE